MTEPGASAAPSTADVPDAADVDLDPGVDRGPEPTRHERFRDLARACTRWIAGAPPTTPGEELTKLAGVLDDPDVLDDAEAWDRYGTGGPVAALEKRVADLLGKPAAAMFPSGIMAQQSVLRVWSERSGSRRVALPGQSHLLVHELDGPQLLHGLQWERLSDLRDLPSVASLSAIPGPLAAVLLELPLRDAGYLLPTWDELVEFSAACRERGAPLHIDGARIWESQPYLGHDLVEIADLADSVYVSFYKGLRGLAGAAIAGPEDVVEEARQWRKRHGGTLFTMMPYAVSALRGLRDELPRMAERHQQALELAAALVERGIEVFPNPPHTNAFRIFANADADAVMDRLLDFMEAERTALSPPWSASEVPGWSWTEYTVGLGSSGLTQEQVADLLAQVVLGREPVRRHDAGESKMPDRTPLSR